MNLDSLRLFRDIVQSRSFSRGAQLNGVSQSAASQHVQELEKSFSTVLLDRSTRPLTVTQSGRLYFDYCRDVLRRRDDFDVALERFKKETEGTVRVASIYSVGLSEMVQLEEEFGRRQPEAHLEVDYLRPEKVYESVLSDEADIGLVSYPESTRELDVIPWREEEMVIAAAPSHELAQRGPVVSPRDLDGQDFVSFDEELPIRKHVDRFLRDLGVEVKVVLHFDNIQMIKEALMHRVGVSIVPARILDEEVGQGRLAAIRISDASLHRPLGIIHRKKKRFHRVAQAFLGLLCEKPA